MFDPPSTLFDESVRTQVDACTHPGDLKSDARNATVQLELSPQPAKTLSMGEPGPWSLSTKYKLIYCQEFSPKEYEYMFIPTRELPELVITMPNRKIVPLTISQGMFPLFTSSVNPWAVCHRAKTNILLCDIAIRGSDWALDLFCLTDIWRLCPPPAFLDEGPGPQGDCRRNEISTDEDAIQMVESRYGAKYSKFLLWLYACADTDWETDISIKDWDEGDEEKFFHTARQQPAWFSESVKGRMMRKWGWGVTFT